MKEAGARISNGGEGGRGGRGEGEGGSKLDSEITLFFYTLQPKWAENYPSDKQL